MEGEEETKSAKGTVTFSAVIVQILVLDIVFSLDSVITAVGMADELWVRVIAVILALGFMLYFAEAISNFVNNHPTVNQVRRILNPCSSETRQSSLH